MKMRSILVGSLLVGLHVSFVGQAHAQNCFTQIRRASTNCSNPRESRSCPDPDAAYCADAPNGAVISQMNWSRYLRTDFIDRGGEILYVSCSFEIECEYCWFASSEK